MRKLELEFGEIGIKALKIASYKELKEFPDNIDMIEDTNIFIESVECFRANDDVVLEMTDELFVKRCSADGRYVEIYDELYFKFRRLAASNNAYLFDLSNELQSGNKEVREGTIGK